MNKVIYFVVLIVVIIFLYVNGVFCSRYELHDVMLTHNVFEQYQDDPVFRIRWFKKELIDAKTIGYVNVNQIGTYELKYYDQDKYIGKKKIKVVDNVKPQIDIKQTDILLYREKKAKLSDYFQVKDNYDTKEQLKVSISDIDYHTNKKQKITITCSDQSGNHTTKTISVLICDNPLKTTLKYHYDEYDNQYEEWWFIKSKNHQRMNAALDQEILKQYHAYYLGKDEKVIYLTYDEGGNDVTYIKEIVDVLNKHDVKATFFVTRNYLLSEQEFMKQLIEQGHMIANHSWHHYDMSKLANINDVDKFVLELSAFEKSYMDVLKQKMPKYFRFPKGGSSIRSLKMVSDLGYKTIFWSHAYYDFASDVSGEAALKTMMDHYHPGAIYMLHPSNKGNYLALEAFITQMKQLGYRFALVDEIS